MKMAIVLLLAFFALIEGVHLHAHYKMDMDVDSYVHKYLRKNRDTCTKIDF